MEESYNDFKITDKLIWIDADPEDFTDIEKKYCRLYCIYYNVKSKKILFHATESEKINDINIIGLYKFPKCTYDNGKKIIFNMHDHVNEIIEKRSSVIPINRSHCFCTSNSPCPGITKWYIQCVDNDDDFIGHEWISYDHVINTIFSHIKSDPKHNMDPSSPDFRDQLKKYTFIKSVDINEKYLQTDFADIIVKMYAHGIFDREFS